MSAINRFLAITSMLLIFACHVQAQDEEKKQEEATAWYADRCDGAIIRFENIRRNAQCYPQKYVIFPYAQAQPLGYALVLASIDEREVMMFTPDGEDLKPQYVDMSVVPKDVYWSDITELGLYRHAGNDITLSENPLPVRVMDKQKNEFQVVVDGAPMPDIKSYNQMIFKPHSNAVHLSGQHEVKKKGDDGTIIRHETEYTFRLNQPSVVAKMFRGYNYYEACPWVVKSSFFDQHIPLQFTRWKDGEPIVKATDDTKHIISQFFGGRRVVDSQWIASIETAERSFYAVTFEHQGTDALGAMVCIAEGEVVSTWEFHAQIDPATYKEGDSIWFVDDEGDFIAHAPEIHCAVATEEGLELYIRQYGGESVQYFILREMGTVWMKIMADYWIYVWD